MFEKFKKKPSENDLEIRRTYEEALHKARKEEALRVAEIKAKQEADDKINHIKEKSGGMLSGLNDVRKSFLNTMDNMPDIISSTDVAHGKKRKEKEMI